MLFSQLWVEISKNLCDNFHFIRDKKNVSEGTIQTIDESAETKMIILQTKRVWSPKLWTKFSICKFSISKVLVESHVWNTDTPKFCPLKFFDRMLVLRHHDNPAISKCSRSSWISHKFTGHDLLYGGAKVFHPFGPLSLSILVYNRMYACCIIYRTV